MKGGVLALLLAAGPGAAAPERVVSLNLCTDQLAFLIAAPGQLAAVSRLAVEREVSAHAGAVVAAVAAGRLRLTSGAAEEVFVMAPDLVLAGRFTTRATVDLLRRLGVRVEEFAPETSVAETRANIARMGRLLGREAAAAALVARLDAGLAAVEAAGAGPGAASPEGVRMGGVAPEGARMGGVAPEGARARAVVWQAGGYVPGAGTLADAILTAAGLENLGRGARLRDNGTLPLEALVLAGPEVIVRGARYAGQSRVEEVLDHPALAALGALDGGTTGPEWVCGTPALAGAVAALAARVAR